MPDYGHRYADKKLSEIDRKLKQTYRQAQKEMKAKLADFNKRFEARSKEMRQDVASGRISQQDYKDWLQSKVFVQSLWKEKINQVNRVLYDHNQQSLNLINNSRLDVFAENYNYLSYIAEKKLVGSFTLYNTEAVARLLLDEPDLLPKWKIDKDKDYAWDTKKINNVITQGIIQGESVPQITERLCEVLGSQDEDRMRTFARTAITGAENAGRQEQMNTAAGMGIKVNKRWEATHDSRTRDSHRAVDGEEVPYDEDFSNGLEYPGDPAGDPAEVYNCRCTMLEIFPEYEDYEASAKRYEDLEIEGQSYEEWKEGKQKQQQEEPWYDSSKLDPTIRGNKDYTKEDVDRILSIAGADYLKPDKEDYGRVRFGDQATSAKIETSEMDVAVDWIKKDNTLYIDDVNVKEQGKGSATRWMEDVVERAKQAGIDSISLYAVRDSAGRTGGYYAWARMGFDGELSAEQKSLAVQYGFNVTHLSDLMATEAGRSYWKEHGTGIELKLDLKDGSRTLEAFRRYVEEKNGTGREKAYRTNNESDRASNVNGLYPAIYDELGAYPVRPQAKDFNYDYEKFEQAKAQYRRDRYDTERRVEEWLERKYNNREMTDEELSEWCSKNGLVVYGNLEGLDRRALYAYSERYNELISRFPLVKEHHDRLGMPFEISFSKTASWTAEAISGMSFGPTYESFPSTVVGGYRYLWDGSNVKGADPANVVFDHEFGHQVFDAMRKIGMERTTAEDERNLKMERDLVSTLSGLDGMSSYATKNKDELFAEAFAAWYGGEKTEFSVEMGKYLERWGVI